MAERKPKPNRGRPIQLYAKFSKGVCPACRRENLINTEHTPILCVECVRHWEQADVWACDLGNIRRLMREYGVPLGRAEGPHCENDWSTTGRTGSYR